MSNAQKLALRLSEIRQKLNELSGKDELTDTEQNDMRSLTAEFPAVEERWRAATVAEGDEEAAARGEDGDGEAAEVRRLRASVRLTDYLTPAAAGAGILGSAAEFNAALSLPAVGASGGVAVPWDVLLTPELLEQRADPERRAFTTTTNYAGGVGQRPILQRLFGADILGGSWRAHRLRTGRADRMAGTHRRGCTGSESRRDRGGHPGGGDVRHGGAETEAPNRGVRIHPRTGGAGCRAGSRATAGPGGCGTLENVRLGAER